MKSLICQPVRKLGTTMFLSFSHYHQDNDSYLFLFFKFDSY